MRIERSGRSAGHAGHQDSEHDIRTQMLHYAWESRKICWLSGMAGMLVFIA